MEFLNTKPRLRGNKPGENIMTTKKTFSDFLANYSSNPDLHKKTLKAGGVAWADIKNCPEDYYAANTGSVPGMIYYSDTCTFAQKHIWLILDALFAIEKETGAPLKKPTESVTQFQNWLAWFAWENMMSEIITYLED